MATGLAKVMSPRSRVKWMPWKVALTFEDIDAAENGGTGDGTAEAKIGVAGKTRDRGTHLKFGRGLDVDIELDVVERRVGEW